MRKWIADEEIPEEFLTRPTTKSRKVFMSGDQLFRLLRTWQQPRDPAQPPPKPQRKRRTRRAPKPRPATA